MIYECRKKAAEFFDAGEPENVAFAPGCTWAVNAVLKGLLREGDHVVVSNLEHNAVMRPLEGMKEQGITWSAAHVTPGDNDATLEAFRNAIRLDTTFVEAIYNKGICISAQAQQALQNIETKPQTLPDSIKALLQEARKNFEQVARLNPHVEEMDWATPLYLVYNLLGEDEKAKAIKPKVEEQKIKKS